jgi:excisionase family DNA binding protein
MTSPPLAYSIAEACKLTSIGRTTIYAAIKAGELRTHKIGRRTLISANDLACWFDSNLVVREVATSNIKCANATDVVQS